MSAAHFGHLRSAANRGRQVKEVDFVGGVPFKTGMVLVNHMLAQLHGLTWDHDGRVVIDNVHSRVNELCDSLELDGYAPRPRCR